MIALWHRLSYQIGIIIFLGFLCIIGFIFLQNYNESRKFLPMEAARDAVHEASLITEAINEDLQQRHISHLSEKMMRMMKRLREGELISITSFAIIDRDGMLLAHSDTENHVLMTHYGHGDKGIAWLDANSIEVTQPILLGDEPIGYAVITFEAGEIERLLDTIKQDMVLPLVVALLLAIALALGASYRVSRPLRNLAALSRQVGSGSVDASLFRDKPDEIRHLAFSIQWADERIVNRGREIEKLAMVVQQADEIVIMTDEEGVIRYVNPSFERITGYSSTEAIGKSPGMLVKSGEHPPEYYDRMWTALKSGKAWQDTFYNRRKDGETFEVSQSISPIFDEAGTIIAYASVQRDITHMRQMEDKLLHMDRVESLGVLAGGIAHDFNNLLTAILGNASLALLHMDEGSSAYEHVEHIEQASYSAADLCRQMLAYSGKGKFIVKSVDMSQLVRDMSKLVDVSISKNISLQYRLAEEPPYIKADVAQIQQVVLNLITNASEAIDGAGGSIRLATGRERLNQADLLDCICDAGREPGNYVYLEVSDTGCGMDEQTQKKIFDPFFTTKFTGRGLGMSAMLGIVNGHHGALRIDSTVGKGTTIRVFFPEAAGQMDAEGPDTSLRKRLCAGTVLLVDDEESLRHVATAMLKELGFDQVLSAVNGQQAVDIFRDSAEEIRLVLLDVTMPVMGGEECFALLRKVTPDVPVIFSSGYNEQEAIGLFTGREGSGFLQKPYTTRQLAEKIGDMLQTG